MILSDPNLDFKVTQLLFDGFDVLCATCVADVRSIAIAKFLVHFYRAMQAQYLLSCSVRLYVRPSLTFVDQVKTNKHIFEIFSLSGSDAILVLLYQRGCRYSDGNPPNGGIKCKGV